MASTVGTLSVELYSRTLQRQDQSRVGGASSISMVIERNGVGVGQFTVDTDNPAVPYLQPAAGARAVITYTGPDGVVRERLTGPVVAPTVVSGTRDQGSTVTAVVADDYRVLRSWLGWPVPTAALVAQTSEYHVLTGSIESVVAGYVQALVQRTGLPLQVATSVSSGASVTGKARMQPLTDVLGPLLEQTRRTVRVQQWTPGTVLPASITSLIAPGWVETLTGPCLIVAVGQPPAAPGVRFSEALGLASWTATYTAPTATRTIVGGTGEGIGRSFVEVRDTTLESAVGLLASVETFTDARDADTAAIRTQRGEAALAEGTLTAGVVAEIVDGSPWTYGQHYYVGSAVPVSVGPYDLITDVINRVSIAWTAREGLTVSPRTGRETAATNPDRVLAATIAHLMADQRAIETRR